MMQTAINIVKIYGTNDSPYLTINERTYEIGDKINDFGFQYDTVLCPRLFKIIVFLALRKIENLSESWVTAEELAWLIDETTVSAVRKFLERRLRSYPNDTLSDPPTHLIEYKPHEINKSGRTGGLSKGPYRLGVSLEYLNCNCYQLLGFLTHRNIVSDFNLANEFQELAETSFKQGNFIETQQILIAALKSHYTESRLKMPLSKDSIIEIADIWTFLGHTDMQLGMSNSSIMALQRARNLYKRIKYPLGVSYTYSMEAHALGQLNRISDAVISASQALISLDSASKIHRKGIIRARYLAALGQQLSSKGELVKAQRKLLYASEISLDYDTMDKANIWCRLAQNAIRDRNYKDAETLIQKSQDISKSMNLAEQALLSRAMSDLMIDTHQWEDAETWLRQSYLIGIKGKMSHHLKHLQKSIQRISDIRWQQRFNSILDQ